MIKVPYVFLMVIFLLFTSCKDKQQPIPQVPIQEPSDKKIASETTVMNPHGNIKRTEKKIEVPDTVKQRWNKVIIVVNDLKGNTRYEQTVSIGTEFSIKGSNLLVRTKEFIPDFKMTDAVITTASNELNNPALRIEVFEGDKSIFKGWLYMKFPDVHPFEHDRYSLRLIKVM